MRRIWSRTLLPLSTSLAIAATAVSAPSSADTTAEPGGTTIILDPDESLRPISEDLFGFNHPNGITPDGVEGIYDPVAGEVDPDLVAAVQEVGPGPLRYPGGGIGNVFRWKRAIGPQEERECQFIHFLSGPASSAYGVDEHARFAERVGAETSIVVNANSGTPEEAADWVEYMNAPVGANPNGGKAWAQVRADNGHPEPYGVTWWEVGNELYNSLWWLSGLPRDEFATKFAFGGTREFTGQDVRKDCSRRPADRKSDGTAGQQFYVFNAPVVEGSLTVTAAGEEWHEITDISTAGPDDLVFELEPSTGRITFGDGDHGAVPAAGARLKVDYTSGPHAGFVDFYAAMKEVDPSIKVCWGTNRLDYRAMDEQPFDCVQMHPYSRGSVLDDVTDMHDQMMSLADVRGRQVASAQSSLKNFRPEADIAVTEYGMHSRDDSGPFPGYARSLDQGLYVASQFVSFIEAGIPLANYHPMMNFDPANLPPGVPRNHTRHMTAFGYVPDFIPQATAHVTNLFSHMLGAEQVASTVVNGPTRTNGTTGDRYDVLRVVASTDEQGRVTLIVVNRDPAEDVDAAVLPERLRYMGDAEVWTVNGSSFAAFNTPENSDAVDLAKQVVEVDQGGFDYTFPAHSVTAIRLTPVSPAVLDPVRIDPGEVITGERGTQTTATVEITNAADPAAAGPRRAAGELTVRGPAGWSAQISPDGYALSPGQSMQATVTIRVPEDTDLNRAGVVVGARQHGQLADTGVVDVAVPALSEGDWDPLFTDTFDDDPVGQAPPEFTGDTEALSVEPADEHGRILTMRRDEPGATRIDVYLSFQPIDGDIRVSYQERTDQLITGGFGTTLLDEAGNRVLGVTMPGSGEFKFTDDGEWTSTFVPYSPGDWYSIDVVLDASTGWYDLYIDGIHIAEGASSAGSGRPSSLRFTIGGSQSSVSSFALDDVAVLDPAQE